MNLSHCIYDLEAYAEHCQRIWERRENEEDIADGKAQVDLEFVSVNALLASKALADIHGGRLKEAVEKMDRLKLDANLGMAEKVGTVRGAVTDAYFAARKLQTANTQDDAFETEHKKLNDLLMRAIDLLGEVDDDVLYEAVCIAANLDKLKAEQQKVSQ
jgi:hypothetical protein